MCPVLETTHGILTQCWIENSIAKKTERIGNLAGELKVDPNTVLYAMHGISHFLQEGGAQIL